MTKTINRCVHPSTTRYNEISLYETQMQTPKAIVLGVLNEGDEPNF